MRAGFWAWFLQRASAVFLVVLLLYHLWLQHVSIAGSPITFHLEIRRFLSGLYVAVDSILLAAVIFHGFNGVRNIVIDVGMEGSRLKTVTGVLWVIGVVSFAYGMNALWPFITGRPLIVVGGG